MKPGTNVLYDCFPFGTDIPGTVCEGDIITAIGPWRGYFESNGISTEIPIENAQNVRTRP